ncbi:MAG: chromate resistance protein ChrB domain-containing protein [Burkholderiales bacterium]
MPVLPDRVPSIDADALRDLAGSARWPQVLDVRRAPAHDASAERIAGALRCAPDRLEDAPAWLDPSRELVCVCVHGHEVSRDAASALRALGFRARMLAGGIEAWRAAGGALRCADAPLPIPSAGGSTWVTRAGPKVDRIACPWLVRRFVDPRARFVYLPEAAGLLALSLGLSRLHADDDAAMLEAAMPMYDALYARSRDARHEPHRWQPGAAR